MLTRHLQAAIGDRARGSVLSLLGAIDDGTVDLQALERHTRRWVPEADETVTPADALEAALIANRLQSADRLDLACSCSLGLLRAHLVAHAHHEFGFWVTYPVRCMRLAEHLALLELWRGRRGRAAKDITDWLARFLELQPGSAHPVSDRHAVSFLAPALLLADRSELLTAWMREAVRWTADRYEGESLGLAGLDASPEQEVDYLLGDLEHIALPRRRESFVAGVLLDLASVLELPGLYDDARHEFHAVETVPELRHPPSGRDAWLRDGPGMRQELNLDRAARS